MENTGKSRNHIICQICYTPIQESDQKNICPKCQIPFHQDCWEEYGGCSIYGCDYAPEYKKSEIDENLQKAHWGIENKTCPYCGESTPMDALECPHCKENLKSATPMSRKSIYKAPPKQADPEEGKVKVASIVFFLVSIIGVLSPVILLVCPIWYFSNRKMVDRFTPIYRLLLAASMFFSCFYVFIFILAKTRM
ncbi:MAG: hypothetical protein LWY06_03965 [Firmicutes bacterium]|nr:hypothetical protein [Bacillota bacterium]